MGRQLGPTPKQPPWVTLPGAVWKVLPKSVLYKLSTKFGARNVVIPQSQLKTPAGEGYMNLEVRGWLAERNGWWQKGDSEAAQQKSHPGKS